VPLTTTSRLTITLPSGRRVSVGEYARSWRVLLATPPETQIRGFEWYPLPAREVLRELRRGMHDRISRHLPWYQRGRKWDHDWQRHAIQTAHAANTPRLVLDWAPRDLRARLAHRLRYHHQED
jgi:hypothetical protein